MGVFFAGQAGHPLSTTLPAFGTAVKCARGPGNVLGPGAELYQPMKWGRGAVPGDSAFQSRQISGDRPELSLYPQEPLTAEQAVENLV